MLRKKIELYHQEEARKKAELENMIREKQEKELRIQREFEEKLKKEELQKRRLRESRQCPIYCVNEKTGFSYHLLYLDSVFKYKNKLVHNQAPIMNWLCPFFLNFHK